MKSLITVIFLLYNITGFSQIRTSLYSEKIQNGYNVLVDNDEFCPVSMNVDLELDNLSSSNGNNKIFVVPAKTKGFVITKLQIMKPTAGSSYKIKTKQNYGDSTLTDYVDYNYSLPFRTGNSFTVFQGYNGSFSHQGENSLDFTMPLGTEVVASRDGVVIKVVEKNNINCPEKKCAEFNNYVLIYHGDGTFSEYIHLKMNGIVVKEGDKIKENDLIGYSGNVGWSNGPHLHFMAFIQHIDTVETIKTKFKINDGKEVQLLTEKNTYSKNY